MIYQWKYSKKTFIIWNILKHLSNFVVNNFNNSLFSFPWELKKKNHPFSKEDRNNVENYRPVRILSNSSKVYETCKYDQIYSKISSFHICLLFSILLLWQTTQFSSLILQLLYNCSLVFIGSKGLFTTSDGILFAFCVLLFLRLSLGDSVNDISFWGTLVFLLLML